MYCNRAKGFTLVELMIVIAILAVLLAIALPSFQGSMRSNRIATSTNELLASISLARTEAIRSSGHGTLCASDDGLVCGEDWNGGWMVWTDSDDNGEVNGKEFVVRRVQGHPKLDLSGGATILAFDARGRSTAGEQSFALKPENYEVGQPIRCVTVLRVGQTFVERSACP